MVADGGSAGFRGEGGVVDVVGVGDEVGVAMCPGDGCP